MKFDFDDHYIDYDSNEEIITIDSYNNELDKPIGWSSICFNETINYYNNCYAKIKIDQQ